MDFNGLKEYIFELCSLPSLSGFEARAHDALCSFVGEDMTLVYSDSVGNTVFCKSCGKRGAPKILIDAHFDEIGLMVREVCEGGFLRVCALGGIDPSIMQAADVIIYGVETLRGVVVSTPPHLKGGDDTLPLTTDMLIDTGLDTDKAKALIPIGTPVGFTPIYGELLNGRIMGKSFDNKACGACALWAIKNTPAERLCGDIYLLFSAVEETNRVGGVSAAVHSILPDRAMVIDVNLAKVPNTKDFETVPMDGGISISVSAATHMGLTREFQRICRERDIPHTMVAAPSSTGTNAATLNLCADGIPVVDVGLPLASMHTYNEVISLSDCECLCRAAEAFIEEELI